MGCARSFRQWAVADEMADHFREIGRCDDPRLPDALRFREVAAGQDDGVLLEGCLADSGENPAHGAELTAE